MKMSPNDVENTRKIVLGCMKILYNKGTSQYLVNGLKSESTPMPERIAAQAVGVLKLFNDRANGTVPRELLLPAAALLVIEIGKFMAETGIGKPTGADVRAAAGLAKDLVVKAFSQKAPSAPAPQPGLVGGA